MNANEFFEAADQVREALEQIAEGTATLRQVAVKTGDLSRGAIMVAQLETLVDAGGWSSCKGETLTEWVEELEQAGREAEAAEAAEPTTDKAEVVELTTDEENPPKPYKLVKLTKEQWYQREKTSE